MNVSNVGRNIDSKTTIVIKSALQPNVKGTAAIGGNAMIEKKAESMIETFKTNWDTVPPLAPLSSGSNIIRQATNISSASPTKTDDDSNSTSQSIYQDESEFAGFELLPGNMKVDDVADNHTQAVNANKMLADLLDRKSSDPPFHISTGDLNNKRKNDINTMNQINDEPLAKRLNQMDYIDEMAVNDDKSKHSSSAANLYAKLAASLLEDEDMETFTSQSSSITGSMVEPPKPVITVPVQRQIIVSPNNPSQMIIAPQQSNNSQMGQATATIKTEGGYQTVPVILQHSNTQQMGNIQIQKQISGLGQQIIQPVIQQQQTQYMLATNQQGQTYLVAQPQSSQCNQILLTQTSQQQGGAPTKTIIILQQQNPGNFYWPINCFLEKKKKKIFFF